MSNRREKELYILRLGRTEYRHCWSIQKELVNRRYLKEVADCLISTEHHPVITLGRGTDEKNLLADRQTLADKNVAVYECERGGDITFHGPGQLVCYPIIDLQARGRDARRYLRDLEQVIIGCLKDFGLDASAREGLTGVWVDVYKVAAIGVAVSRWITYHGLALNVNTDLAYFKLINPCGITRYPVGTMASLLGRKIDIRQVENNLITKFAGHFGYDRIEEKKPEDMLNRDSHNILTNNQ